MKKLLFALLLLLLPCSCLAASINVQNAIPADTVWSFSAELEQASSFDNAEILLDGVQAAKINGDSGIYFPPGGVDETKVLSKAIVGESVYLSLAALNEGTHTIRLNVDGDERDSEEVLFFEVLGSEGSEDIQSRINSLTGSVNSLIEQFNGIEALNASEREQLESSLAELNSLVDSLEQGVRDLQVVDEETESELSSLRTGLQSLSQKTNSLDEAITGSALLSLASNNATFGIIVLVIAAFVVFLLIKNKDKFAVKSVYRKHAKEEQPVTFSKREEEIASSVLEESQGQGKGGKWAFGEKKPVKEGEKRFQLGDLLKKD